MEWLPTFWYQPLYCLSKILKIIKVISIPFKRYLEKETSENLIFSVQFRTQSKNIHTFSILAITFVPNHQKSKFLYSQVSLNVKSQLQQKLRFLDAWLLRYMEWLPSFWCLPLYCLSKNLKITKLISIPFKRYLEQDPSKNLIFSVQFRTQINNIHIFSILAITFVPDHQKSKFLHLINSNNDLYPFP
jgi:hypothetical protein